MLPNFHPPLVLDPVSPAECSEIIKSLKISKQDLSHISVSLFKEHHQYFLPTICNIFNSSFTTGVFPACFKHATIVPIFKKGDSNCMSNYRPIAILPFLSKVLERCVFARLTNYAYACNLFSQYQFGFTKGKSTQDAIILLTEKIYECFNATDGSFCLNIFVDFQKCFDTIDHVILLEKLRRYGITGPALDLLTDYLSNRTQSVRISNCLSTTRPILKGVLQGSVLGVLLLGAINNFLIINFQIISSRTLKCPLEEFFQRVHRVYPKRIEVDRGVDRLNNCVSHQGVYQGRHWEGGHGVPVPPNFEGEGDIIFKVPPNF